MALLVNVAAIERVPAENVPRGSRRCGTGAYVEVVTDKYVAPPMAMKMHKSMQTLYKT